MFYSLQALRGIAAWMVVFHHIEQSYYMGNSNHYFWQFFSQIGGFGVDVFFVLSGFVMALASKKYNGKGISFAVNRFFRVMPVYWIYTLVLLLSILLLPLGSYLTAWDGSTLFKSLLLIPNLNLNGYGYYPTLYVGWTLTYEMFFYLVFSIALAVNFSKPVLFCVALLTLITVLTRWTPFLGQTSFLLIEFIVGMAIYKFVSSSIYQRSSTIHWLMFALLVLLNVALFFQLENTLPAKILAACNVVLFFIFIDKLFDKKYWLANKLILLGEYSYSTYLCHIIVIGWFSGLLGVSSNSYVDKFIIVSILLVVYYCSKVSYIYIEKNHAIYSLRDLITRKLAR